MDIEEFNETFPHLAADGVGDPAMIGRKCRFGEYSPLAGDIVRHGTFEIIGYQLDHAQNICYRVRCIQYDGKSYDDQLGRVMPFDQCLLLDEPTPLAKLVNTVWNSGQPRPK